MCEQPGRQQVCLFYVVSYWVRAQNTQKHSSISTCGAVLEGEALKGRDVGGLGDDLSVVRYGSCHGVADDDYQLHVLRHSMDSCWRLHSNEVTWRLLHNNLAVQGFGHHTSGSTGKICCRQITGKIPKEVSLCIIRNIWFVLYQIAFAVCTRVTVGCYRLTSQWSYIFMRLICRQAGRKIGL